MNKKYSIKNMFRKTPVGMQRQDLLWNNETNTQVIIDANLLKRICFLLNDNIQFENAQEIDFEEVIKNEIKKSPKQKKTIDK